MPADSCSMALKDRFASRWDAWDEEVHDRGDAAPYLAAAKDEELLELLAGWSDKDRKYERDIIAVEIQNRLAERSRKLPGGADDVLRAAFVAYGAAASSQKAIHAAEAILKASGDIELGRTVSASAYLSLDTTKLAMEAAQAHAAEVQAALTKSRIAEQLVEDAAEAAREAAEKAELGAKRVAELGHTEEAEAARAAAKRLRETAEEVARRLRESRKSGRHEAPHAARDAADQVARTAEKVARELRGSRRHDEVSPAALDAAEQIRETAVDVARKLREEDP